MDSFSSDSLPIMSQQVDSVSDGGSQSSDTSVEMASDVKSVVSTSKIPRQETIYGTPSRQNEFKIPFSKEKFGGSNDSLNRSGGRKKSYLKEPNRRSQSFSDDTLKQMETARELRKAMQEQIQLRKDLLHKENTIVKLEGRVQLLLREKSSLQSAMASFKKEGKELKRANDILKMKVGTLEGSMVKKDDAIRHELAAAKCRLVSKDHELSDVKNELSMVRNMLSEKEQVIEKIAKSNILEEADLGEKITSLELALEETSLQMEELKKREMSALEHGLSEKEQLFEEAKQRSLELDAELAAVSARLSKSEECATLNENLVSLVLEDKESMSDCYESLIAYKESLEKRVTDLETVVLERNTALMQTLTRNAELSSQIQLLLQDSAAQELEEARGTIASLSKTLDEVNSDKHVLEENLKTMTSKYEQLDKLLGDERQKAEEMESALRSKLELSLKSLNTLEDENKHHRDVITSCKSQIADLTNNCKSLKEEVTKLEVQLSASERELEQVRNLAIHARASVLRIEAAESKLWNMIRESTCRLVEKESECKELHVLVEMTKKLASERDQEVVSLRAASSLALEDHRRKTVELEEQISEFVRTCETLREENRELKVKLQQWQEECGKLQSVAEEAESAKSELQASSSMFREEMQQTQERFSQFKLLLEECNNALRSDYEELDAFVHTSLNEVKMVADQKTDGLAKQVESSLGILDEIKEYVQKIEQQKAEITRKLKAKLREQIQKMEARMLEFNKIREQEILEQQKQLIEMANESSRWKNLYLDLRDKVEPFKEQLDAYQLEKNFLLGQHTEVRNELDKLCESYAKLIGHQNQKQKIHYMNNLKTELARYREEVFKLREENLKQMKLIHKLKGAKTDDCLPTRSGHTLAGARRGRGLQHTTKENMPPSSSSSGK